MPTPKIQKNIEIVRTTNKRLSSLSLVSAEAICATLRKYYDNVNIFTVDDLGDLVVLGEKKPDLVFMGMGYIPGSKPGEKVWLATYLEEHGIAHTGSSQASLEYERNKAFAKQRVQDAGLKTSNFFVIKNGIPYLDTSMLLKFPLFLKPTSLGGGAGIDTTSVVHNYADLRSRSNNLALSYSSDSLVEEYLPGREFSVAIIQDLATHELIAMPLELVTEANHHGDRILSREVKAGNQEKVLVVTDQLIKSKISNLAVKVFVALGASSYGRIDIRLDAFGVPHFLEANLLPSLIEHYGNFPKACMLNIGLGYDDMLLHIIKLAQTADAPLTINQAVTAR